MKKVLFSVLVLSVFVVANASAKGQAYLWGGYTTVSMTHANDILGIAEKSVGTSGDYIGYGSLQLNARVESAEVSKIKNAFIGGIDYLFDINESGTIKVGPRLAFLQANKAKVKKDLKPVNLEKVYDLILVLDDGATPEGASKLAPTAIAHSDHTFDVLLVPIMFGGSYNQNVSEKFSLNGKLFVGYGLVKTKSTDKVRSVFAVDNEIEVEIPSHSSNDENDVNGGCFVGDISIGAQYWLTKRFGLGFDLGYRFTPETEIKAIKVDFSGLATTLNLSYKI